MTLYEFFKTRPKAQVAVELGNVLGSFIQSAFMEVVDVGPDVVRGIRAAMDDAETQQLLVTCCFGLLDADVDETALQRIAKNAYLMVQIAAAEKDAREACADDGD